MLLKWSKSCYCYFDNLFVQNESLSDIDQVTCYINRGIVDGDNAMLCDVFDPEKFYIAIFQMHKDK